MMKKDKPGRGRRAGGAADKPKARIRKMDPGDLRQARIKDHLKPGGDGGSRPPGDAPGHGEGQVAEMPVVVGSGRPVPTPGRSSTN